MTHDLTPQLRLLRAIFAGVARQPAHWRLPDDWTPAILPGRVVCRDPADGGLYEVTIRRLPAHESADVAAIVESVRGGGQ